MKKMLKLGLLALLIILITNCASCNKKPKWDWKARPYVGVSEYQLIMNGAGQEVLCSDSIFNEFACFDKDNMTELKFNIARLKMYINNSKISKKKKKVILKLLDNLKIKGVK